MVAGVTTRSALAASAIAAAAASAKRGKKKRRRTPLTPCGGRNGVDDAVGGTSAESCCAAGFGGTRDWSGLPDPAVHLILTALLPSLKDAFSLGSVCRAWRSVFAACKRDIFSALPPLLVDRGSSPSDLGGFYALRERRFHRRKHNSDFWPWTDCRPLRPTMDVIGVSHGYWIVRDAFPRRNRPSPIFLIDPLFPEVRICLPQTPYHVWCAVMAAPPASPDCVVVLMESERILYCRPGDTQWVRHSFVEEGGGRASICLEPDQVAIAGGKLYAMHKNGKVVIVELFPRPTVTFLETELFPRPTVTFLETEHSWSWYRSPPKPSGFLMESNGEILHVYHVCGPKLQQLGPGGDDASCSEEHKFIVRRLDVAAQEWVTLSTLGDRCLFLKWGATCVTSVAPARWGGEGDCIYASCLCLTSRLLIFHMKDGRTEHHPMPKEYHYYDWLIPSFCY